MLLELYFGPKRNNDNNNRRIFDSKHILFSLIKKINNRIILNSNYEEADLHSMIDGVCICCDFPQIVNVHCGGKIKRE